MVETCSQWIFQQRYVFGRAEVLHLMIAFRDAVASRRQNTVEHGWRFRTDMPSISKPPFVSAYPAHILQGRTASFSTVPTPLPPSILARSGADSAERQGSVFGEYLLVDTPVVFEHKGIVRIGYEQHVEECALSSDWRTACL